VSGNGFQINNPGPSRFTMQASPFAVWPVGAGILAAAAFGGLALEHRLPAAVRITPSRKRAERTVERREPAPAAA